MPFFNAQGDYVAQSFGGHSNAAVNRAGWDVIREVADTPVVKENAREAAYAAATGALSGAATGGLPGALVGAKWNTIRHFGMKGINYYFPNEKKRTRSYYRNPSVRRFNNLWFAYHRGRRRRKWRRRPARRRRRKYSRRPWRQFKKTYSNRRYNTKRRWHKIREFVFSKPQGYVKKYGFY